jgi:ligand-binding sensor domain-containing protein
MAQATVFATEIQFSNYGLKSGLNQGTITDIERGPHGFVWIATADGLHRFDGHSFKVYRGVDQSPGQLLDNYIHCVEWVDSFIWVGTHSGRLFRFEPKSGYFTEHPLKIKNAANADPILNIKSVGKSLFLALEEGGAVEFILDSGNIRNLFDHSTDVYDLEKYKDKWYAVASTGFYCFSEASRRFEPVNPVASELKGRSLQVVDDTLWLGTYGQGLWNYDGHRIRKFALPKWSKIRFINQLGYDTQLLWIGSDGGGLVSLDPKTGKLNRYTNNPLLPQSLVSDNVLSIHYDEQDILFVGSINGLSVYNKNLRLFELIDQFRAGNTIVNNNVYSIFQDRSGNYWFGTLQGGLVQYQLNTDQIKLYPSITTSKVSTRAVRSIYQSRDGVMWIGTRDEGLFTFDPEIGKFTEKNGTGQQRIPGKVIRFILEDRSGDFWVGTNRGLALYDRESNTYQSYNPKDQGASSSVVYDIRELDDQTMIIGLFKGGLMSFDKQSKRFSNLNTGSGKPLQNQNVMCLHQLNNDTLLIGTYGGGMAIYNMRTKTFSYVTEQNGLPNNAVYGIVSDDHQGVWLSTNKGLCRYDLKTGLTTVYGLHYYLQDLEYNEGAFLKDSEGRIFFGGVDGVNYFSPENVIQSDIPYDARIVGVNTLKRSFDRDLAYNRNPKINIAYNENLLSIEFTSFAFGFDDAMNYQYQMVGFDADWIASGKRNVAYYTKLSPGTYQFKVRAFEQNPDQSAIAEMQVVVLAPFWKRWWFFVLCGLVAVGIGWLLLHLRTRRIQENFSNKLMEMELKALRGQMNPHFIFNSLNSIQYFILKKEPKEAYKYLSKFSGLMRKILQNSRERFISLSEEVETLELYLELEDLRMDGTLDYQIQVDESIDRDKWAIPTMLIQPFVENAIIHGLMPKDSDRKLTITIERSETGLITRIEDNGIGISASRENNRTRVKKHRSAGVDVTEERLKVLSTEKGEARLTIQEVMNGDEVIGTRVTLLTPKIIVE